MDKQFQHKVVSEYQNLNIELIGQLPLIQRIGAYRQAGLVDQALELTEKTLSSKDREQSREVLEQLTKFHARSVNPIIREFLQNNADPEQKLQLINGLKFLPVFQALPLLKLAFEDENPTVRDSVADALGKFAGQPDAQQAIELLVTVLSNTNSDLVHRSVAYALGKFAGQPDAQQAIEPLVTVLSNTNSDHVRQSVADTLGNFAGQPGAEQAATSLTMLLKNATGRIQENTARALTQFSGQLEIQAVDPTLQNLRKVAGKVGYLATLNLALMNPDRLDLTRLESSDLLSTTNPEQSNNPPSWVIDQNAALLIEGFDALDKQTQIFILPELGRFPSPLILSKLMELEQQRDSTNMRTAALLALGKSRMPKALNRLQAVAENPQESRSMRVQSINALGHSRPESAVEILTKLAQQEPFLTSSVYAALDRLDSPLALPFLEDGLTQQAQRHQDWRKKRDTWKERFNDEQYLKEKNEWIKQLKNLQPNPALETWFARQISRLSPVRAAKLLRHDLYAVRQGAWLGIAQRGGTQQVAWLVEQHAKENNPLFRFALYRAIDHLLLRLMVVGTADDIKHLQSIYKQWNTTLAKEQIPRLEWSAQRRVQETILQRIDWTLSVLKSSVG